MRATVPALITGALLVTALIAVIVRQHQRILCLRYCYINLSDWAATKLGRISEDVVADLGREGTSDELAHWQDDWNTKLKYHHAMMLRAGLSFVNDSDVAYPLRDND
jgi:hypothetical protein